MPMTDASCYTCPNTNCLIYRNCLTPEAAPLLEKKHTIKYKKGLPFIVEGAPVFGLFFIYRGKAKVVKGGINGREQVVRLAGNGDVVGHRGFGTGQFYPISSVTLEDSLICNFTNEILNKMLATFPQLTYDFMLFYARQLSESENKVKKFAQMTVREKVIDTLLYIHEKFGQANGFLNVRLSRKEIADAAGTTDEQVVRVLSSLKKEELVSVRGKQIGINYVELLKKEIALHN